LTIENSWFSILSS